MVDDEQCPETITLGHVTVRCERDAGHDGRHWTDTVNWPRTAA